MFWICPRCGRINHSSPLKCFCGKRVRQSSSSSCSRSSRCNDDDSLIDVVIMDTYQSDRYSGSSDYNTTESSSQSYDSGSSDSGSCD